VTIEGNFSGTYKGYILRYLRQIAVITPYAQVGARRAWRAAAGHRPEKRCRVHTHALTPPPPHFPGELGAAARAPRPIPCRAVLLPLRG
jgi:hypothetical protein